VGRSRSGVETGARIETRFVLAQQTPRGDVAPVLKPERGLKLVKVRNAGTQPVSLRC